MYVKYGAGAKPFNKGSFSFLIAFSRQLEQALDERPDELEDTLGALANGLAYLTGEDSGLLPGDGEPDDGSDDDVGEAIGVQDEVAADVSARHGRSRQRRNAGGLGRAVAGERMIPPPLMRTETVAQQHSPVPTKGAVKSKGVSRGKGKTRRKARR